MKRLDQIVNKVKWNMAHTLDQIWMLSHKMVFNGDANLEYFLFIFTKITEQTSNHKTD